MPAQELFNQYDLNHSMEIDYWEYLVMMHFVDRVSLGGRVVSDEGESKRKTEVLCMCLCRSCSASMTWTIAGR